MLVKITDYGEGVDGNFIRYHVSDLNLQQAEFLKDNLDEKMEDDGDALVLTMHFDDKLYPFQSEVAKVRLDDFIAREEIEMTVFLSSVLEDMYF